MGDGRSASGQTYKLDSNLRTMRTRPEEPSADMGQATPKEEGYNQLLRNLKKEKSEGNKEEKNHSTCVSPIFSFWALAFGECNLINGY